MSVEPGMTIRCQEVVELITDYLEGQLDETTAPSSRRICRYAKAATSIYDRCARRSRRWATYRSTACPRPRRLTCSRLSVTFPSGRNDSQAVRHSWSRRRPSREPPPAGRHAAQLIRGPGVLRSGCDFFAWKPGVAVSAIASAFVGPTHDRSDPDGGTRLNRLRGSRGNQKYPVPADVQLGRPPTVLIWCRPSRSQSPRPRCADRSLRQERGRRDRERLDVEQIRPLPYHGPERCRARGVYAHAGQHCRFHAPTRRASGRRLSRTGRSGARILIR